MQIAAGIPGRLLIRPEGVRGVYAAARAALNPECVLFSFLCIDVIPLEIEEQSDAPGFFPVAILTASLAVKSLAEVEIIPELAEFVTQGTVIHKQRYSAFFGTDLAQRVAELKPDRLIVAGVCTDICVMHTVADARNRDYAVEVVQSAVASFDPEAHRFALRHMDKILGAKLV